MSVQIEDVPQGLAPFHFAGVVNNPSVASLSVQTQRLLVISDATNEVSGVKEITDIEQVNTTYGEESTAAKMIHAAYKANRFIPIYALVIHESLEKTFEEQLEQLPEVQFTQVATSFNDAESLKSLDKEMESRWGSIRQIDGHVFVGSSGSISELETKYADISNLKHITIIASSDSEDPDYIWASTLAAVNGHHAAKPFLPYQTLPLPNLKPPNTPFKLEDRITLLYKGFSTHQVEDNRVQIDRIVTFHTKDKSYRDLSKKQILSYLRYDFVKFLKDMYPRHALSNDETQADSDVVTPKSARDFAIARHLRWKEEKYVQDPDKNFKKMVTVKIAADGETLEFYLPVQLMGQLRRTITTIAFTP